MAQPSTTRTPARRFGRRSGMLVTGIATLLALAACTSTSDQPTSTPVPAASNTATTSVSTTARPTLQEQQTTSASGPSAPSSSAPATGDGATVVVEVAVANAQGQPMPGYTSVEDLTTPIDCTAGAPNPSAVGVNTHDCSPHAANAHACWGATGSTSLVCSWDARSKEVRTYRTLEPLVDTPAATDPIPWAVDLANGLKCDLALGGAFGGRADGYHPAYTCDDPNTFVLASDAEGVVDRSGPQWTVKTGGLSADDTTTLPPPTTVGVVTAYFAATAPATVDSRARSTRA